MLVAASRLLRMAASKETVTVLSAANVYGLGAGAGWHSAAVRMKSAMARLQQRCNWYTAFAACVK